MKSAIIVDSTAYLDLQLSNHPDVYQVNLSVNFSDGTVLKDTSDPQLLHDFYKRLKSEAQLPTTTQPQPGDYLAVLNQLLEKGYEVVYCIHLSGEISGTFQTARMLTSEFEDKFSVYCIDSGSSAVVMVGLVERALEWIAQGIAPETIYEQLVWSATHSDIYLMVEDLKNLVKGGRLSSANALLGGVLQIRPLLHFENGKIVLSEKIRTNKKVYRRLVELVGEWLVRYPQGVDVKLVHADSLEEIEIVKAMIEEAYPELIVPVYSVGPVVGAHTGSGTKGIGFIPRLP